MLVNNINQNNSHVTKNRKLIKKKKNSKPFLLKLNGRHSGQVTLPGSLGIAVVKVSRDVVLGLRVEATELARQVGPDALEEVWS